MNSRPHRLEIELHKIIGDSKLSGQRDRLLLNILALISKARREAKEHPVPDVNGEINIPHIVYAFLTNQPTSVRILEAAGAESIHLAAHSNDLDSVKALIHNPRELSRINKSYECFHHNEYHHIRSPLHSAAQQLNLSMIKCLIEEAKANPNTVDFEELTPLEYCFLQTNPPYDDNFIQVLHYLIPKTGFDFGRNALFAAVTNNNLELVKLLIKEFNCDLAAKDNWDCTVLDCARSEVRDYLLSINKEKDITQSSMHYQKHLKRVNSKCMIQNIDYEKIYQDFGNKGSYGEVHQFVKRYPKIVDESEEIKDSDTLIIKKILPNPYVYPIDPKREAACYKEVYGFGEADGDYIAMPFVRGKPIHDLSFTTSEELFNFSIALVNTVNNFHIIHERIHGDLHGENILVHKNRHGKFEINLIDFGFSTRIGKLTLNTTIYPYPTDTHFAKEAFRATIAIPSIDVHSVGYLLNRVFKDAGYASVYRTFFKRMMADNPAERPALSETRRYLLNLAFFQNNRMTLSHHSLFESGSASQPAAPMMPINRSTKSFSR